MQYRNYEIQICDFGVIIRDSKGNFIMTVATEDEAIEYIKEGLIEDVCKKKKK